MQIFKNFPGKHAPGLPWNRFCYLGCLKLTLPEKTLRLKSDEIFVPFPEKNSEYASDTQHFQKAYVRPFPNLNVLVFS